jgi:hypothetical protein
VAEWRDAQQIRAEGAWLRVDMPGKTIFIPDHVVRGEFEIETATTADPDTPM